VKKVSMLDFRLHAEKILSQVQKGQAVLLTRRGKPVARIEPIVEQTSNPNDPFFLLSGLGNGPSIANAEMDDIIYGQ